MPTYDYVCDKCGHTFDAFQSINDSPLKKCPSCKKVALRRIISGGSGVIFRGSGFYVTDSKTSGKNSGKKVVSPAKSDSTPEAQPADSSKKGSDGKTTGDTKKTA